MDAMTYFYVMKDGQNIGRTGSRAAAARPGMAPRVLAAARPRLTSRLDSREGQGRMARQSPLFVLAGAAQGSFAHRLAGLPAE